MISIWWTILAVMIAGSLGMVIMALFAGSRCSRCQREYDQVYDQMEVTADESDINGRP